MRAAMNRPAFFDSVGDRLAGLIRHGILADERPEEPRRIDDCRRPERASWQQPASRRRRKPVEIDRALGRLEVARAGAAFAGRQHFSNQGWGYV
jgi:hypothetical protein